MHIAIIGGGPAALFMFDRLIHSGLSDLEITIFEKQPELGAGMPYSPEGANKEHVTNVSSNELPTLPESFMVWVSRQPKELLQTFHIDLGQFHEFRVFPRLLFGKYLTDQFHLLINEAKKHKILTRVLLNTIVDDIEDEPQDNTVIVHTSEARYTFQRVIICTGHNWPKKLEGNHPGYFDSPYPPSKFSERMDNAVAIRGSSLTAIDAIRTLARKHGAFETTSGGRFIYRLSDENPNFRLVMHSLGGLLPAVRFHLDDTQLSRDTVLSPEEVSTYKAAHGGFIPLDLLFEHHFLEPLKEQDPGLYETLRHMKLEEFVEHVLSFREQVDPFNLLKAEYAEAEKSIKRKQSVHWKELLAVLSFAMNYPAKHLSAEDMLRLQQHLKPLISIVIAFVPQESCREMIALHDSGILSIVSVDKKSHVNPQDKGGIIYAYTDEHGNMHNDRYKYFVDAVGQPALPLGSFPFESLVRNGVVSPATLQFKSPEEGSRLMKEGNHRISVDSKGDYFLQVQGIAINDQFQLVDRYGAFNERIYNMAVPYMGGFNPDYSGLDFCETASLKIISAIHEERKPDALMQQT